MMLVRVAKRIAKTIGSPVLDGLGVYERRIQRCIDHPGTWTIVMYHRVVTDLAADPFRLGMCVREERFRQQIEYFKRRFTVIGLSDAIADLDRGDPLPPRALSITFDDGYLDNFAHAFPVMQSFGVPYSLFIPTGGLAEGEMLWWDKVIAAFACTEAAHVDLADLGLSSSNERLSLSPWRRPDVVARVLDLIWELPEEAMRQAVSRVQQQLKPRMTEAMSAPRLSITHLRRLHEAGVEIGAHSVRHPNLARSSDEETRDELTESRSTLESLLQTDIRGLAYPGGRMREGTARIARDLGFRYALATRSGANAAPLHRFELRRVGMPDSPMSDFRRAVSVTLAGGRQRSPTTF